jgi:CubicO group peptidase (beta-lactamase class C family)
VPPKLAALTDVVPSGSLTKTFTAAAVMRLVDAGEIDLDEPVVPFANIVLIRQGHTSLGDLYPPIISNVSFRDLLSMRSGLSDYGSSAVHVATETELDVDLNPIAYLLNDTLTPKKTIWR